MGIVPFEATHTAFAARNLLAVEAQSPFRSVPIAVLILCNSAPANPIFVAKSESKSKTKLVGIGRVRSKKGEKRREHTFVGAVSGAIHRNQKGRHNTERRNHEIGVR